MQIPFYSTAYQHQAIRQQLIDEMTAVLDSNWYIQGSYVQTFEEQFAAFCQTSYCVGMSNGLDALHLGLRSLNIGPGDEVIVSAHCFLACVLAITHTGAIPVLVEPDVQTYNLDIQRIEDAITSRTKAIIAVHMYGQPCDMQAIMNIAAKHRLWVMEDLAQAQGAIYQGHPAGSWGHLNATSFYPVKNLGALGDAGAIVTNNAQLAQKVRSLQSYGFSEKYYASEQGYNARLDEMQAAILSVKLKQLTQWNQQRQQIADYYLTHLADIPALILPYQAPYTISAWHLFVIRTEKRAELQKFLQQKGIGTLIHYPVPVHLQQAYQNLGFRRGDFPITEAIADTCLSLPLYPGLSLPEIDYIVEQIHAFFR